MLRGMSNRRCLWPVLGALLFVGCRPAALHEASTPESTRPHRATHEVALAPPPGGPVVVLVALDGVRWQDVFEGVDADLAEDMHMRADEVVPSTRLMPALSGIVSERGAAIAGPAMKAHGPDFMSAPGYAEMLTGRGPAHCANNSCPPIDEPTLLDEIAALPGVEVGDVAAIASWDKIATLAAEDPSHAMISAGRHAGATRERLARDPVTRALFDEAAGASEFPGHGDYRPDRFTAAIALHYLDTHEPRFLFIGLGDTDEYAHRDDYRGYLDALRFDDGVIAWVAARLDTIAARGRRTLLVVTTDHGRGDHFTGHGADYPESAEVWMVASGTEVHARGRIEPTVTTSLADVAATIRVVAGIATDPSVRAGRAVAGLFDRGTDPVATR